MAERRMFAKTIIDSDAFLEMPLSSQALYFHLSIRADDEGFINNPKSIMRTVGTKDDDMNLLIAKKFIIPFESGVVVIKHWKIHNYIQNDRFTPTKYPDEKSMLSLDENKAYRLENNQCIQDGYTMDTQVSIGKVSIGKEKHIVSFSNETLPYILSELLFDSIQINDDKFKKPDLQKWSLHVDRLIRLDNRNEDEIRSVIEFATSNEFWKSNILSTKKLRDKFPTLLMQMNRGDKNGSNQQSNNKNKKSDWNIEGIIL